MKILMVKKSAIIVCDHGLGHIRRCALMAKELEKAGGEVSLFAPSESVSRLQQAIPYLVGIRNEDFSSNTTPENIKNGIKFNVKNLPNLDQFNEVISDNLIEILEVRPDAVISAQFFWHDVIVNADENYVQFCKSLLKKFSPKIIGCNLFTMQEVRSQPGFEPTGLYTNPDLVSKQKKLLHKSSGNLLITGGTTPIIKKRLLIIVNNILKNGKGLYKKVHVDKELLPNNCPSWMLEADFSVKMYSELKDAICRPGLGVLTDLLTVGVKPHVIFEDGNREMAHNASILEKNEIGSIGLANIFN
jgi:hypothetical protein